MRDQKYLMAQAALLQQYAIDIRNANNSNTYIEQQAWYTKACLTANQLKTLTVKEVYLNIEAKLESIEEEILLTSSPLTATITEKSKKYVFTN